MMANPTHSTAGHKKRLKSNWPLSVKDAPRDLAANALKTWGIFLIRDL